MAKTESPKLNNGQRKAIAKSKEEQIDKLISLASEELSTQRGIITAEVASRYGVDKKYDMIDKLQRQIADIKATIAELGFHSHPSSYRGPIAGGEPAQMVDRELEPYRERQRELVNQKQHTIEQCWTAETVADIPVVVGVKVVIE